MKSNSWIIFMALAALLIAVWCAWQLRTAQTQVEWLTGALHAQSEGQTTGSGDSDSAGDQGGSAAPSLSQIMNGIQIDAAKLYYSAEATNWPLAQYETGVIEDALAEVPVIRPQENGVPLGAVINAFKNSQWATLKEAVGHQDLDAFRKSYKEMVFICNACHQATGRPFIQITVPTQPPVPNQLWAPAPPPVSGNRPMMLK